MKKTKKALVLSIISLLLCFSMLLGTTWAWFTDKVSSANNKIQTGTLKIDLELLDAKTGEWNSLKNSKAPIFNYENWEPGYVDVKILKVENEGSLALKWSAKLYSETQLSILANVIDVYVCTDKNALSYPADRALTGYTPVGSLSTFINTLEEASTGVLEAKEAVYFGIALKMREDAGNEYENLSLGGSFDIRISAIQHTHEFDGFDNIYDILADESIVAAGSKTLSDGVDVLDYALTAASTTVANVNVPADAVLDPTQPVTVVFDGIDPEKTIEVGENTKAYAFDITVSNLKSDLADNQMITIVVAAPKGLPGLKAYHNGVLIPDAIYDEVAGTITFKTSSFSPFAFAYTEVEAGSLAELREQVENNERLIKLTSDLIIDLSKGGIDRSADHVLKSGSSTYYNAVNINSQNVAIDLNGHSITVSCGTAYNANKDVGALFFVDEGGSLNIVDNAGGGFIKMASSIYAVWAPYAAPSYVDIFNGIFIADSYAGDLVGTPVDGSGNYDPANGTMKNENSNRTLIYAGFGGRINVYGGYFLYNNTPNDTLDRNNGAFNCKDFYGEEGATPLITIHGGVKLINNEYRQNPANTSTPNGSFDNYSILLAAGCKLPEEKIADSLTVDGKTYDSWYMVYSYTVTYKYLDGTTKTEYVLDNTEDYPLTENPGTGNKWIDELGYDMTTIPAGNTKDITVSVATDENYGELITDQDVNGLFAALAAGKTVIMSQDLEGSKGNANQTTMCTVTSNSNDKDALLNLNGKTLDYEFKNPSGKHWNIFEIVSGCTFTLTPGTDDSGTLKMVESTSKSGNPVVFILRAGSTLRLQKGTVVELHYNAGASVMMFEYNGSSCDADVQSYYSDRLTLETTTENGMQVLRLTALETVEIKPEDFSK